MRPAATVRYSLLVGCSVGAAPAPFTGEYFSFYPHWPTSPSPETSFQQEITARRERENNLHSSHQFEVNVHLGDHFNWPAIDQGRFILPLAHRIRCGHNQQRVAAY